MPIEKEELERRLRRIEADVKAVSHYALERVLLAAYGGAAGLEAAEQEEVERRWSRIQARLRDLRDRYYDDPDWDGVVH